MKKYDGVGWTNVKEPHQGARKELVGISRLNMPPKRVIGGSGFACEDLRTLAYFRAEPFGLSDKGFDLPFYRRQMGVLEKINTKPGVDAKGVLKLFTQWEREEIYPRLGEAVIEMMMEELQGAGYIDIRDGKAFAKG